MPLSKKTRLAVLGLAALLPTLWAPARAAEPVAIIEEIFAAGSDLQIMDYLYEGQVVELGEQGQATIGYLRSCWLEEITSGVVTVGRERSQVDGGAVQRRRVDCGGEPIEMTEAEADNSAVMVFRKPTKEGDGSVPEAQITLHSTVPLIQLANGPSQVVIERLDQDEPGLRLRTKQGAVDLADTNAALQPGGTYRVSVGEQQLVVRIEPSAGPVRQPIIGRLLRL